MAGNGYASLLHRAITRVRDCHAEITEIRRALTREAMATLNGWSRDPGADFPIHIEADRDAIYIGRSSGNLVRTGRSGEHYGCCRALPKSISPPSEQRHHADGH
jgi:hypothetical protein